MTNEEIDIRLKMISEYLPQHAQKLRGNVVPVAAELELLNMSMMAVYAMLGEIAKRLPEQEVRKPL